MNSSNLNSYSHQRLNPLTGEWILVSPHRTSRPWNGKQESPSVDVISSYDENCYLCAGNERAGGKRNQDYKGVYVFDNDFSAIQSNVPDLSTDDELFQSKSESGICRVICFSEDHSLTFPLMSDKQIADVVNEWSNQYVELGSMDAIGHVQIFENKGEIMGCSNPHPHGQIWAQESVPQIVMTKNSRQNDYFLKNDQPLLLDYLNKEIEADERVILENEDFVAVVPYWAVWPFETMILPKRHIISIDQLNEKEVQSFAGMIKTLTVKYDNLFECSFPYSAGIHQAPTDGGDYSHWQMHMSFYPPLLRSASVKKFMVGYEMFGTAQRDLTPEESAARLKEISTEHYSLAAAK